MEIQLAAVPAPEDGFVDDEVRCEQAVTWTHRWDSGALLWLWGLSGFETLWN